MAREQGEAGLLPEVLLFSLYEQWALRFCTTVPQLKIVKASLFSYFGHNFSSDKIVLGANSITIMSDRTKITSDLTFKQILNKLSGQPNLFGTENKNKW